MKIVRKNETKEFKNSNQIRRKIRAFFEKKGKSLGVIVKELGLSKNLQ